MLVTRGHQCHRDPLHEHFNCADDDSDKYYNIGMGLKKEF